MFIKGYYQEIENEKKVERIGLQIIGDLKRDTTITNQMVRIYVPMEKMYLDLIRDSINGDALKECQKCPYLISSLNPFIPNQNGYLILKNIESDYLSPLDTLIQDTKIFYSDAAPTLELIVDLIKADVRSNLDYWRENKNWYYQWAQGIITEELDNYMDHDPKFKNRVASYHMLLYNNYLMALKQYSFEAGALAERWEKEVKLEVRYKTE